MFKVEATNIKINTKIGVSESERKKNQILIISIKFNYSVNLKKNLDNIHNLKDYSKIIKFLKRYIKNSRCKTLEKLVTETKKEIKKQFKIQSILLKIEKPTIAKKYGCDSISVSK